MSNNKTGTLKARYSSLTSDRQIYLDRAIEASRLTIPTLIPEMGHNAATRYYTPWQSVGATGVNNLANKMLLALLPPNQAFFRLRIDEYTEDKLAGTPDQKALIEEGLAKVERAIQDEIETSGLRSPIFNVLRHLIVGGNCCLILPKDQPAQVFGLYHYVTVRDSYGNMLETITREVIDKATAPAEIQSLIGFATDDDDDEDTKHPRPSDGDRDDEIELYTTYYRAGEKIHSYQEVCGQIVPGSEGSWPIDKAPIMVLRWTHVDGENYGRGHVESVIGDLISLEGLSRSIVEASAAAARVVYVISPNSQTHHKDFAQAESGDVISGDVQGGVPQGIGVVQSGKQADLSITFQAAQKLEQRLALAFLVNSSVQRQAERVTAEEVRFMAQELETSLGGVYSQMATELQLPLVNRIMAKMTQEKKLPGLPKGVVKPALTTGLDALGRGNDTNKLLNFIQAISQMPSAIQMINWSEAMSRLSTSMGLDPSNLIKTPDQLAAEQQQAAQAQQMATMANIAKTASPAAVKAISDHYQPPNNNPTPSQ